MPEPLRGVAPAIAFLSARELLLRLQQSLNVRSINRGHSNHVAMAFVVWCPPVLDELAAVISQGGRPGIHNIDCYFVRWAGIAIVFGNRCGLTQDVGRTRYFHIVAVI